jgi:serine/threonine-protein kinase
MTAPDFASVERLPADLAVEVDRVCGDFEADWLRAAHEGRTVPDPVAYLGRVPEAARPALERYLREAEQGLRTPVPLSDLSGYELLKMIGEGAMGVVYRAREVATGRLVAVKIISHAELARVRRLRAIFELEGEVVARLRHPNIVPVEKLGEHDGQHYLVMPLVEGQNLKQRRAEFLLACPEGTAAGVVGRAARIAALLEKVARAVHHLHRHGVLHRDLKPSNILLDKDGEPLVCDFGLARRFEESEELTLTTQMIGTPAYMAPEQMEWDSALRRPLTVAADVWALGAVLYELLTGRPPFVADNPGLAELMRRKREHAGPDAPSALPDSDLEWICLKCLRREPAERFGSAEELADALRRYQDRKRVRPVETAGQRVRRWLGPVARPPVDPDYIDRWRTCLRVEAATSFVAQAGMFALTLLRPAGMWLWLWFLLTDMALGWLVWWPLQLRRRLSSMEQNLVQLWSAVDVAVVVLLALFCPFLEPATPEAVARFYMAYAVLRGLIYVIEGRMCWGRLYLVGPVFYAVAVVMRFLPEYAPLLHGATYSSWFIWLSFRRWKTTGTNVG